MEKKRCSWCNMNNELYIEYHDKEWGILNVQDDYLFEMLLLESFQAGLSWECVLNKRSSFKEAFDDFDVHKIAYYDEKKITSLGENPLIIRNKRKIKAVIQNARVFIKIQKEFGSFYTYLCTFTKGKVIIENDKVTSSLSDQISEDLKARGMSFVGSTIIYSYLQAIGVIHSHEENCFLYKEM